MDIISLKERQEISLNILKSIDDICKKNSIQYYLAYGTLLGAVRHKGFIPWDDDIDIWVRWNDYYKLIYILQKESNYEILNNKFTREFPLLFSKLSDKNTLIEGKNKIDGDYKRGIAVDIFPIANYPINKVKRLEFTMLFIFNKLFSLYKMQIKKSNNIKGYLVFVICKLCLLFRLNDIFWIKKMDKFLSNIKKSGYLFNPFSVYRSKDIHKSSLFDNSVDLRFEDRNFEAPIGWNEILNTLYGDYMKFPPKDKRKGHPNELAFRKSKKEESEKIKI